MTSLPNTLNGLWRGISGKGCSLLSGSPKLGKTTFAYQLIVAIAAGLEYLGNSYRPSTCSFWHWRSIGVM